MFPSRIGNLVDRLERGEEVTQADVDRQGTLIALDMAKVGEDFVLDWIQRQEEADADVRDHR